MEEQKPLFRLHEEVKDFEGRYLGLVTQREFNPFASTWYYRVQGSHGRYYTLQEATLRRFVAEGVLV